MKSHRLTPEQALLGKEWKEINGWAWKLRRMTGDDLEKALAFMVPEGMREEVRNIIKGLQKKHGVKDEI